MSRIYVGTCDLCGEHNASLATYNELSVCRVCDPENWQRASDEQKDAWLRGDIEDANVWNRSGHSQR